MDKKLNDLISHYKSRLNVLKKTNIYGSGTPPLRLVNNIDLIQEFTNDLISLKTQDNTLDIFIKDWEDLDKINKESDTHTLKVDVEGCCGWIIPKDITQHKHYLSTHTFYGKTHEYSTRLLKQCGFNVKINNWDDGSEENIKYSY